MRLERTVVAGSALLAAVALGLSASALETAAISSSPAPDVQVDGDESGPSVLGALALVLDALLALLGIDLEPTGSASASGSALEALLAVANVAYPVAIPVLVVLLAGVTGAFLRRLPPSTVAPAIAAANPRWWIREPAGGETASDPWPPETASDSACREWLELIDGLEASRPRSRTPAEWATAAVDAGYDESYVEAVTWRFRETRYGPDRRVSTPRNRTATDASESEDDD